MPVLAVDVEIGGSLVQDDQRQVSHHGLRDVEPPPLFSGKIVLGPWLLRRLSCCQSCGDIVDINGD